MYAGRIVEEGPVADLLEQPAHPYTQGLLKSVPKVTRRQRPLPTMTGSAEDAWALTEGCRFAPRCPLVTEQCHREEPTLILDTARGTSAACWVASSGEHQQGSQ
jgi:oligopeptide/dipeptide ABC transporter ATP-binding protein